jgi:hypothetical protein
VDQDFAFFLSVQKVTRWCGFDWGQSSRGRRALSQRRLSEVQTKLLVVYPTREDDVWVFDCTLGEFSKLDPILPPPKISRFSLHTFGTKILLALFFWGNSPR